MHVEKHVDSSIFLEITDLRILPVYMAESILAYNSGTKIFLNIGFVQGQTL